MIKRILVTGAAGCIGIHLVAKLKANGHWVRTVDTRQHPLLTSVADETMQADLRRYEECLTATYDVDQIFHLAADTGGVHFRHTRAAQSVRNNTLINLNLLEASRAHRAGRILFASSTAVYAGESRLHGNGTPIVEEEAASEAPQDSSGWEKLFTEQVCRYYQKDFGLDIRIARLQGIYGPHMPFEGGKEIGLAALCRDIARAQDGDAVAVWGDGKQIRSFLYVDDCVDALIRIMDGEQNVPFNVGSEDCVSINDLTAEIASIAGKTIVRKNDPAKLQGARARRIDTNRLREVLAWAPKVTLREGLERTYRWIESELRQPLPEATTPRPAARKKAARVRAFSRTASTVAPRTAKKA